MNNLQQFYSGIQHISCLFCGNMAGKEQGSGKDRFEEYPSCKCPESRAWLAAKQEVQRLERVARARLDVFSSMTTHHNACLAADNARHSMVMAIDYLKRIDPPKQQAVADPT